MDFMFMGSDCQVFASNTFGNDRLGFLEILNHVLDFRNSGLPPVVFCSIGSLNFDEIFEFDVFFVKKKSLLEVVQHLVFSFNIMDYEFNLYYI